MNRDEATQCELSILLAEYTALKTEIVSNLASARQVAGLTMTAVGALLAASPFVVTANASIVLLIAPIFFYLLACTQLRYVSLVLDMGRYLRLELAPAVVAQLRTLERHGERGIGDAPPSAPVMRWEDAGRGLLARYHGFKRWAFIPIAGANFGVPLLAAASSATAYAVLPGAKLDVLQIALVTVDVVGFAYCAFWGWTADKSR